MTKPQIGLIGCFQNGKSTLVNCLLGNRVALTGEGVAKTKRIVRYAYGNEIGFRSVDVNGIARNLDKTEIQNVVLSDKNGEIYYCEMILPSPLLKDVDIVDTPGFDANQTDTSHTTGYIKNLDFIFFVIGGGGNRGGLNEAEKQVLAEILRQGIPFSVLYNCCDFANWKPDCDNVGCCIQALESSFRNNGIKVHAITEDGSILPVNLAWYWQSLLSAGLPSSFCFFKATEAENALVDQIDNYFYKHSPSHELPPQKVLAELSNISLVKRYIIAIVNFIGSISKPVLSYLVNDKEVYLSWEMEDNNYIYEIGYRIEGDSSWITTESTETKKVITDLKEGQVYEFRVCAKHIQQNKVSDYSTCQVNTCASNNKRNITSKVDTILANIDLSELRDIFKEWE